MHNTRIDGTILEVVLYGVAQEIGNGQLAGKGCGKSLTTYIT